MCAGIRDVAVLAWRLKGYASDKLSTKDLINYQDERFPHVSAFIKLASEVGKIMSNPDLLKKSEKSESMRLFDFPKPRLKKGFFYNCSLSGTLFPQFIENNKKSDDSLGYKFVFLVLKEDTFYDVGIDNKILFRKTAKGFLSDWMAKNQIVALIIRPDKYIFGSAPTEKNIKSMVSHFYDLYRI